MTDSPISRRDFVRTSALLAASASVSNPNAAPPLPASPLKDHAITHAALSPVTHPRLGVETNSRTAVRYLRFLAPAAVDRLELGRIRYGRHVPAVPCHPAHVIVSLLNEKTFRWEILREVDFPEDPALRGEGLTQEMTAEEMESHFNTALGQPPYIIELNGVTAKHLRVECTREHPVWPNHGECNGGPFNVPYGILNNLKAHGRTVESAPAPTYNPILKIENFHPEPPQGMRLHDLPNMLLFEGEKIAVGFSLQRPMLIHFGWDAPGAGMAKNNRLLATRAGLNIAQLGGLSGPLVRAPGFRLWRPTLDRRGCGARKPRGIPQPASIPRHDRGRRLHDRAG